jgi:short-subunit dehydrogenase
MARISDLYATAFVTGASSGLGRAFAEMLLTEGVRVWGTSRDPSRLAPLARSQAFVPVALDLASAADAGAAWTRAAAEAGGAFDLAINNAGYGVFGRFASVDSSVWEHQIEAMLGTTLRLAHAAYGGMRARDRGCLVNVSSLAAEFPLPYLSGYNVAKAGLSALSESLVFESRGTSVNVIDFRPGDYRTAFNQAMRRTDDTAAFRPAAPPRPGEADPERVWRVLEHNLRSAPPPERAAADLRRALLGRRRGIVRSGSFFQARLAPMLARITPEPALRSILARYFGG